MSHATAMHGLNADDSASGSSFVRCFPKVHLYVALVLGVLLGAPCAVMAQSALGPLASSKDHIRVAAVQMDTEGGPQEILAAMRPYVIKAAGEGADLIVFPEYILRNFKVPDTSQRAAGR